MKNQPDTRPIVLVLNDREIIQDIVKRLLIKHAVVLQAFSLDEARRHINECHHIDMIAVDATMPYVRGGGIDTDHVETKNIILLAKGKFVTGTCHIIATSGAHNSDLIAIGCEIECQTAELPKIFNQLFPK